VLDEAADVEILAFAEVQANANGEVRVPAEQVFQRHRAIVGSG
jgi:hypothetical protein